MSDAPLLAVKNVSTRIGGGLKLDDVSLEVRRGELVCILGANGAGKTSLLGAIAGLWRPTSGSILLEGKPISGLSPHRVVQAGIALAPQNHPIFDSLTVDENLGLGRKQPDATLFRLFPNLASKRRQRAGRLSGGERQMLSMAQVLMTEPKLCLLDEPSSGLAPLIFHQVFAAVRELADSGLTVLMVEQNASAALRLADRAYVMEHGRLTLEGPAKEIADNGHVRRAYLGL